MAKALHLISTSNGMALLIATDPPILCEGLGMRLLRQARSLAS
jgi:hypothetical protein